MPFAWPFASIWGCSCFEAEARVLPVSDRTDSCQRRNLRSRRGVLDRLSDDLIVRVFAHAPFYTHGTLCTVCRRFETFIRSQEFRLQRVELGTAEHGVIIAGGNGPLHPNVVADSWMSSNGRWRPIPPMIVPRSGACSAIIDDEMWVMGGWTENRYLDAVEVYSPKTNSWRSCTPMNKRRYGAVAGVVGGLLVVAGGFDGNGPLASVEAYTGTGWITLPEMPDQIVLAMACVLNERLFVMGGYRKKSVLVLETTEKNGLSWTARADLPTNRDRAASVVHDGKIWLIGGNVGLEPSASVFTYDIDADVWKTAPSLPVAVHDCSAATLNGSIILCGTSDCAGPSRALVSSTYRNSAWSEPTPRPGAPSPAFGCVLVG